MLFPLIQVIPWHTVRSLQVINSSACLGDSNLDLPHSDPQSQAQNLNLQVSLSNSVWLTFPLSPFPSQTTRPGLPFRPGSPLSSSWSKLSGFLLYILLTRLHPALCVWPLVTGLPSGHGLWFALPVWVWALPQGPGLGSLLLLQWTWPLVSAPPQGWGFWPVPPPAHGHGLWPLLLPFSATGPCQYFLLCFFWSKTDLMLVYDINMIMSFVVFTIFLCFHLSVRILPHISWAYYKRIMDSVYPFSSYLLPMLPWFEFAQEAPSCLFLCLTLLWG